MPRGKNTPVQLGERKRHGDSFEKTSQKKRGTEKGIGHSIRKNDLLERGEIRGEGGMAANSSQGEKKTSKGEKQPAWGEGRREILLRGGGKKGLSPQVGWGGGYEGNLLPRPGGRGGYSLKKKKSQVRKPLGGKGDSVPEESEARSKGTRRGGKGDSRVKGGGGGRWLGNSKGGKTRKMRLPRGSRKAFMPKKKKQEIQQMSVLGVLLGPLRRIFLEKKKKGGEMESRQKEKKTGCPGKKIPGGGKKTVCRESQKKKKKDFRAKGPASRKKNRGDGRRTVLSP